MYPSLAVSLCTQKRGHVDNVEHKFASRVADVNDIDYLFKGWVYGAKISTGLPPEHRYPHFWK